MAGDSAVPKITLSVFSYDRDSSKNSTVACYTYLLAIVKAYFVIVFEKKVLPTLVANPHTFSRFVAHFFLASSSPTLF